MKQFNEQEVYKRLFNKMTNYSNSEFPIIDFLNDVRDNPDKRFDKETAYKGLEKMFDTFMEYHNDALKYKQLEKEMKCPLKAFFSLIKNNNFYYIDYDNKYYAIDSYVFDSNFIYFDVEELRKSITLPLFCYKLGKNNFGQQHPCWITVEDYKEILKEHGYTCLDCQNYDKRKKVCLYEPEIKRDKDIVLCGDFEYRSK